jgi:hypothetical protein
MPDRHRRGGKRLPIRETAEAVSVTDGELY